MTTTQTRVGLLSGTGWLPSWCGALLGSPFRNHPPFSAHALYLFFQGSVEGGGLTASKLQFTNLQFIFLYAAWTTTLQCADTVAELAGDISRIAETIAALQSRVALVEVCALCVCVAV